MMRSTTSHALVALVLALFFAACSDSTTPAPPQGDDALFEGEIDPGLESFLLARIDQPGVLPLHLDLVGSNFRVDAANSQVLIDVAVLNRGQSPLYPTAIVWISGIQPPRVSVANADILPPTMEANSPLPMLFGFDYSESLGEDGVLEVGEESAPKTWIFFDPEMVSFSFMARAEFALENHEGEISGVIFQDSNQNGVRDPDEGPFPGAEIWAELPNGQTQLALPDDNGVYRLPVQDAGLHQLRLEILVDCISCITTPSPRQVIIVPDADGSLQSVHGIDFGAVCAPCVGMVPPVRLTEDSPDSIGPQDYYTYLEGYVEGSQLHLRVGFSGCGPDHRFELVAGRAFMESFPVATWLRLLHDSRGELCAAYFERDLIFELSPIQEAHIQDYGEPGVVRLLLRTPSGMQEELRLEP